ncbi:MAG: 23S rRNA (guanosine(2251)-2'-O)-methyltransferase RlmB [Pseudomonadota bacterium]
MITQTIFGKHAVRAALKSQPERCQKLLVLAGASARVGDIETAARAIGLNVQQRARDELDELVAGGNHQGVVLHVTQTEQSYKESDLPALIRQSEDRALVLVLDGVQDPHNLGACLRSAEAIGVDVVVVPKDKSCDLTPTVRKVACGAAETVPFVRVTNLVRTLQSLQELGVWIAGAAGEADMPVDEVDFDRSIAVVMGAEAKGLRQLTRKACDYLFSIPMSGEIGSFNVSVACGICLYEAARQRRVRSA